MRFHHQGSKYTKPTKKNFLSERNENLLGVFFVSSWLGGEKGFF